MRLPLQYALFYPRRMASQWTNGFDITKIGYLSFKPLELERYPCFSIALEAARAGRTYPAALCAADEVAVEMFLDGGLDFTDIPRLIQQVLDDHIPGDDTSLDDIKEAYDWARRRAREFRRH